MTNQPLGVDNPDALMLILGKDCPEDQWIRELTQNGIEAVLRAVRQGVAESGTVTWHPHWIFQDESVPPVIKLSVTDTGIGMSKADLQRYIGKLSSSGGVQGFHGNFGIGAKIAAFPRNPAGLFYTSLTTGAKHAHRIWVNRDDRWGLHPFDNGDLVMPVDHTLGDSVPSDIREVGHGTQVVLCGKTMDEDTFKGEKSCWDLINYLNSRYYRLPSEVTLRVWQFDHQDMTTWVPGKSKGEHRTIHGQKFYLDRSSTAKGTVDIGDALAHWWLMPADAHQKGWAQWTHQKHVGIIYQDEIYNVDRRRANAKLRLFGLGEAAQRCIIYVEPKRISQDEALPTASRSGLQFSRGEPPWEEWGFAFARNLPPEIESLRNELGARDERTDFSRELRDEFDDVRDLYEAPSFVLTKRRRPNASLGAGDGDDQVLTPTNSFVGGAEGVGRGNGEGVRSSHGRNFTPTFARAQGKSGELVNALPIDLPWPIVRWVRCESLPPHEQDEELIDRAARYAREPGGDVLYVNEDFRDYKKFREHLESRLNPAKHPRISGVIRDEVRRVVQRCLIETVIHARKFVGAAHWDASAQAQALDPITLTMAVGQKWHGARDATRRIKTEIKRIEPELLASDVEEARGVN